MPIRFRCPHCNQLIGIARRKTGITVRCPSCDQAVVVPAPNLRQASQARRTVEVNQPRFERSDFDDIFRTALTSPQRADSPRALVPTPPDSTIVPESPPPAGRSTAETTVDVKHLPAAAPAPAPPNRACWIISSVIAVLAFGAGLLIGLALK